jgi:hypothetical protein
MSEEKKEERKAGGPILPWMRSSARVGLGRVGPAGSGSSGLWGGLSGRLEALFLSKAGFSLILGGALAYSAYGLWDMHDRGGFGVEARKASFPVFHSRVGSESGGESGLGGPSSLDLAARANKDAFGAAEAKNAAEAAQAAEAKDAASAQAKKEEAPAPAPAVDAAAIARQMAEAGKAGSAQGAGGQGFGRIGSGIGGLAGGQGLAGGIGQGFAQPKFAGTPASSLQAMVPAAKARVVRGLTPAQSRGPLTLRGANARRLQSMQRAMAPTRTANPEAGAAAQTQQWTNSQPTGTGLSGAGTSGGTVSGSGSGTGGAGAGDGGPVETSDSGSGSSTEVETPSTGSGKNVTPYQGLVDAAAIMLMVSAALTMLACTIWLMAKAGWVTVPIWFTIAQGLCYAAAGLAGMAALVGLGIMSQGQYAQGGLFTLLGGLAAVLAWKSAANSPDSAAAQEALKTKGAQESGKIIAEKFGAQAASSALTGGGSAASAGGGALGGQLAD